MFSLFVSVFVLIKYLFLDIPFLWNSELIYHVLLIIVLHAFHHFVLANYLIFITCICFLFLNLLSFISFSVFFCYLLLHHATHSCFFTVFSSVLFLSFRLFQPSFASLPCSCYCIRLTLYFLFKSSWPDTHINIYVQLSSFMTSPVNQTIWLVDNLF